MRSDQLESLALRVSQQDRLPLGRVRMAGTVVL